MTSAPGVSQVTGVEEATGPMGLEEGEDIKADADDRQGLRPDVIGTSTYVVIYIQRRYILCTGLFGKELAEGGCGVGVPAI